MRFAVLLAACALLSVGARAAEPVRIKTQSADLLVVGLVQDDRMNIHVSRILDNAPVRDAIVTVTFRGAPYPTVAQVEGGYAMQSWELVKPGAVAVEFHVVASGVDERLNGTLEVAAVPGKTEARGSARQYLWWVLNFAVCGAFLVLWARRRKRADADN
jgi:hypothetical protein